MSKRMKWKNMQATSLPIVYIRGQQYFFDERAMELRSVDNPHLVYKFYQRGNGGNMTNFEVAEMFTNNALAYAISENLNDREKVECLEANLSTIQELLQDPTAISDVYERYDLSLDAGKKSKGG